MVESIEKIFWIIIFAGAILGIWVFIVSTANDILHYKSGKSDKLKAAEGRREWEREQELKQERKNRARKLQRKRNNSKGER